jgi:chemotaxis-related protein WspD
MIADCWNTIGVRGDGSCPELKQHAHCRNCPVYAAAATELLRAAPADEAVEDETTHFARTQVHEDGAVDSVVIFRVANEWLALPTSVVTEVANPKPVHALPHRAGGIVLGVTNVRGELVIAVSLKPILGVQTAASDSNGAANRTQFARLLVLRRDAVRVVCPVDEVHGVVRFGRAALRDVPATLAKAGTRYSTKLLPWNGHSVGLLDDQLLFYTVKRSIA